MSKDANAEKQLSVRSRSLAALQIQAVWRGYTIRSRYFRRWVEWIIDAEVQHFQQGTFKITAVDQTDHAAARIQAAWRAHHRQNVTRPAVVERLFLSQEVAVQVQRLLNQEEVFHRSRLSEWEMEERRMIYHLQLYHRLALELQMIETRVRKRVDEEEFCQRAGTLNDFITQRESIHVKRTRSAILIQAHWRGFTLRRLLPNQIYNHRRQWEQHCEDEDWPLVMEERYALMVQALEAYEDIINQETSARQDIASVLADWSSSLSQLQSTKLLQEIQMQETAARRQVVDDWHVWADRVRALGNSLQNKLRRQEWRWTLLLQRQYFVMLRTNVEVEMHSAKQRLEREAFEGHCSLWQERLELEQKLECNLRDHVTGMASFELQWLTLAAVAERYRIRWDQFKSVTIILGLCAVKFFQEVAAIQGARAALEFTEQSARAALVAEWGVISNHMDRKRDWERRMMASRSRRQALELVEAQGRQQIESQHDTEYLALGAFKQEHLATVLCRKLKATHVQRWMRGRLERLRRLARWREQMAATRIQASWRGHHTRSIFAHLLQRKEEERMIQSLQDVERRHLFRLEAEEFQSFQERWSRIWSTTRLKRHLLQARLHSRGARVIQRWWRQTMNREQARRMRETVIERQERAGRQVLVSDCEWKSKRLLAEYTKETQAVRHRLLSGPSAICIQRIWRGHVTRRRLPRFLEYKEEVTSVLRLWRIERQLLTREEHDAWADVLRDAANDRAEVLKGNRKIPPIPEPEAVHAARRQEMEAAAHRKRVQDATKRRQVELQEERNLVAAEEQLERKSILRSHGYWLNEAQETFAAEFRQATLAPWLMSSHSSSRSVTPPAASLGPLRVSIAPSRLPTPPLAGAVVAPPRPMEELPALKRVPLQHALPGRQAWSTLRGPLPDTPMRSISPLPPLDPLAHSMPLKGRKVPSPSAERRKAAPLGQHLASSSPAAATLPAVLAWKRAKD